VLYLCFIFFIFFFFFFFFQAEDGIRDYKVTGVQTCALPISLKTEPEAYSWQKLATEGTARWDGIRNFQARNNLKAMSVGDHCFRSEERRVGKECRSWGWGEH